MNTALENIKVLDLGHNLVGPWCAMFLGDLGAAVIKVEPLEGDEARRIGPFVGELGKEMSSFFVNLNRNKKSIALNLDTDEGRDILRELIVVSDILIENFDGKKMSEIGFTWQHIHEINPTMVYASITGCGRDTVPGYEIYPACDLIAQSLSGLMSITGEFYGEFARVGAPAGDFYAAAQAAIGILAALFCRKKRGGKGQWYDGAEVDALSYVLENAVVRYTSAGTVPRPLGGIHPAITPFQEFKSKDSWLIVPCGNDKLWALLCGKIINRDDLIDNPKFINNAVRTQNRDALNEILNPIFEEKTTAEWVHLFEGLGHPVSSINNIEEITKDANTGYRGMVTDVEQPGVGKVMILNSAMCHMTETPGRIYAPAPQLGENTEEILSKLLRYTEQEVAKFKGERIRIVG